MGPATSQLPTHVVRFAGRIRISWCFGCFSVLGHLEVSLGWDYWWIALPRYSGVGLTPLIQPKNSAAVSVRSPDLDSQVRVSSAQLIVAFLCQGMALALFSEVEPAEWMDIQFAPVCHSFWTGQA